MITAIIAFITALPALSNGITGFLTKYYDVKLEMTKARIGGDTEVAKALVTGVVQEGQVRVSFLHEVAQSKFLMFLMGGFAIPPMLYNAKVIVWDTMLGLGSTPAIHGDVALYMNIVVTGIFGVSSVAAVTSAWSNWRKTQ